MDILIEHGLIITVDAQRRILTDGAIAIKGDRIVGVGKTDDIKPYFKGQRVINAKERVVMPGLIDSHNHFSQGQRGFIPDNTIFTEWLFKWMFPMFVCLTPKEEYLLAKFVLTEHLKNGCTTIVDGGTTVHPEAVVQAIEETGARANIGCWAWDTPFHWEHINPQLAVMKMTTDQALKSCKDTFKKWHGAAKGRVNVWVHLLGGGMETEALARGAKQLADELGVGWSQHESHSRMYVESFMGDHKGRRPIEYLADLGVLGSNVRFVHMVDVSDNEMRLLKEFDVKVVEVPLASLKLGWGATVTGKFPEMMEQGITVALGVDGGNCSNAFDMVRAMYVAAVIFKDSRQDVNLVPAEKSVEMATINGAKAILLENQIGSIEVGKKADITLFDSNRPEWMPLINVIDNLIYSADGHSVDTVIIDGRVVVEGGRMILFDEEELYEELRKINWAKMYEDRLGLRFKMRWPVY